MFGGDHSRTSMRTERRFRGKIAAGEPGSDRREATLAGDVRRLSWRRPEDNPILLDFADVQANILSGHVRDEFRLLFYGFGRDVVKNRAFVHWVTVEARVKSMEQQLTHHDEHRTRVEAHRWDEIAGSGTPYVGIGLSAKGYVALDRSDDAPDDPLFRAGMTGRPRFGDDPQQWEQGYATGEIGMVVLLADSAASRWRVTEFMNNVNQQAARNGVALLASEWASQPANLNQEPFGFSDGLSQPIFLAEELPKFTQWDPSASFDSILVEEPGRPASYGTYLVYRKLEQDVAGFQRRFDSLIGPNDDPTKVQVQLAGRDRSGVSPMATTGAEDNNDFNYADDEEGARCPFRAHARLMNGREPGHRTVLARRGQAYGPAWPADPVAVEDPYRLRSGLYFVAMNASIEGQYADLQERISPSPGMEPMSVVGGIGDNLLGPLTEQLADRRAALAQQDGVAGGQQGQPPPDGPLVTVRGGEYFFLPSLGFLKDIRDG
jgi:deferrochelatase/peroxidase EfeB